MTIGDRIRELRKTRGITQEGLSEILGLERSSIAKYEGKKNPISPSDDVKIQIADYFGVSVDYLLGHEVSGKTIKLSNSEKKLISGFRALNPDGQNYILQQLAIAQKIYVKSDTVPDVANHAG